MSKMKRRVAFAMALTMMMTSLPVNGMVGYAEEYPAEVTEIVANEEDSTENIISHAMYIVRRENLVKKGDIVVFTAGDPATNMISGEGAVTNIMQVIQAK